MRKVVLGERNDLKYYNVRPIPLDGTYKDTAYNVMDLHMNHWDAHYLPTGYDFKEDKLYAYHSERNALHGDDNIWFKEDDGILVKHTGKITLPSLNDVFVKFTSTKSDGTKLHWINSCIHPTEYGNTVNGTEVFSLKKREEITAEDLEIKEVHAIKFYALIQVEQTVSDNENAYTFHLERGRIYEMRHYDEAFPAYTFFNSCPKWKTVIDLFSKTYMLSEDKIEQKRAELFEQLQTFICENELMRQWEQFHGIEVSLKSSTENVFYKTDDDVKETGYEVEGTFQIKDAYIPTKFEVDENCPCITSSNIIRQTGDTTPLPVTVTDETAWCVLDYPFYVCQYEQMTRVRLNHYTRGTIMISDGEYNDFVQITKELNSDGTYRNIGKVFAPKRILKQATYPSPNVVSNTLGYELYQNIMMSVTRVFSYEKEHDVFLGASSSTNVIIYPWDAHLDD